jgi:hypothetical protein
VLDLSQDVPADEVEILQDHPGAEEKSVQAKSNWFDNLKVSQAKYIAGQAEGQKE